MLERIVKSRPSAYFIQKKARRFFLFLSVFLFTITIPRSYLIYESHYLEYYVSKFNSGRYINYIRFRFGDYNYNNLSFLQIYHFTS